MDWSSIKTFLFSKLVPCPKRLSLLYVIFPILTRIFRVDSRGTYLLLEKCKTVCYRNLFKRIHIILDKHQISLAYVAKALKWLGMPIDLDEVECILANLIYRGYIRGYLSHSKRVLVLSKKEPFPVSAVVSK